METHPIQAMLNEASREWQRARSETQMTLGKMIDRLTEMQPDAMIDGLEEPHSYRGYYSDLAFKRRGEKIAAKDALAMCRSAMGEVFRGYKGGDFQMGRNTPVWVAEYGCTGQKIMAVRDDGSLELANDD